MSESNEQKLNENVKNVFFSIMGLLALLWVGYNLYPIYLQPDPKSMLDGITKLGVSTSKDFANFRDEGGLNKNPAWHGLFITSINVGYNGNGNTLSRIAMQAKGKSKYLSGIKEWSYEDAAPKEYRAVLTSACKLDEGTWTITDTGGSNEGKLNGKAIRCTYVKADNSSNDTILAIENE